MHPPIVVKADGTKEPFSEDKLRASLRRAGTPNDFIENIVREVLPEIKDGMTTSIIYREAFHRLMRLERRVAGRYSLKRAIAALGPSGFPFEKYVAEIYAIQGFKTVTNQMIRGNCVPHEVDVVAWNDNELQMIEVKFHADESLRSDLKVALYVKARFDDIRTQTVDYGGKRKFTKGGIVTNTKFTDLALRYGECAGLSITSWNHPTVGNLHDLIERANLHPVTSLSTLNHAEQRTLLSEGVVLCRTLSDRADILEKAGVSKDKIDKVTEEVARLCYIPL